jgi:hypothetical protein
MTGQLSFFTDGIAFRVEARAPMIDTMPKRKGRIA